jgi:rare lipoprotein A
VRIPLPSILPVLAAALLMACGGHRHRPPEKLEREFPPTPVKKGVQEGVSSWYGKEFDGRPTASGEIFDMNALTAAHRTLPLGTTARVTCLDTGRDAVLKINDRGPFVEGRILDCSYGAAKELGFAGKGVARVRLEVIEEGKPRVRYSAGPGRQVIPGKKSQEPVLDDSFCVQAGAFSVKDNALKFRDLLESNLGDAYVIEFRGFWRVRVGHLANEEAANELLKKVREMGHPGFVTRND